MMIAYFSINFATKYVIHDFWLIDSFAILLLTMGIYFILKKNDLAFLIIMTIGAMIKESVLFVLPLCYSLQSKKMIDLKLLKKTVIISFFPIVVLILIRIFFPALNSLEDYLKTLTHQLKMLNFESSEYNIEFLLNKGCNAKD